MALSDQMHTARFPLPHYIKRAKDTLLKCPIYLDGALVEPDSGTVEVFDENGTSITSDTVTVTASVAEYTVLGADTTGLDYSDRWRVVWTLTFGSDDLEFENDAYLVRTVLYPVISDVDLFRYRPAFNPVSENAITREADYQDFLDEAWVQIETRLEESGRRPNLILNPSALRTVHLHLTCYLIYCDLRSRLGEAYVSEAADQLEQFESAWQRISLNYDADESGVQDEDEKARLGASLPLWFGRVRG